MYDKTIIKLMDKPQTRRYLRNSYNELKEKTTTVEKQTKNMQRQLTEETGMANKYMKICSILSVTRQMKSKIRYHFIIILAKI